MAKIDGDRLLRDLYALRKIGEYRTGCTGRPIPLTT